MSPANVLERIDLYSLTFPIPSPEATFRTKRQVLLDPAQLKGSDQGLLATRMQKLLDQALGPHGNDIGVACTLLLGVDLDSERAIYQVLMTCSPAASAAETSQRVKQFSALCHGVVVSYVEGYRLYDRQLKATGREVEIHVGDPKENRENTIFVENPAAVDALQTDIFEDRHTGSQRADCFAHTGNGQEIVFPAAPGLFPESDFTELMEVAGTFEKPSRKGHTVGFIPADKKAHGKYRGTLKVDKNIPQLMDRVSQTHGDGLSVVAHIAVYEYRVAGKNQPDRLVLVEFS